MKVTRQHFDVEIAKIRKWIDAPTIARTTGLSEEQVKRYLRGEGGKVPTTLWAILEAAKTQFNSKKSEVNAVQI